MTPHTHKVCPPGSCPLPRSPSEGLEGSCCRYPCHATGHTDLSLSPRNAVAVLSTEGQSSASTESGYQIKCITHGQNCSSSTSSMTSLMSQGMQRVCFFPLPKSLSMMETGIYHRPCPWWEQGAHEAALHLLPLSWKRLVQVGLTPFSVRATRGKENRTERRGESGGECMEPNHFTSFCKLETRYG